MSSFDPVIKDGVAYVLFAYDVGMAIDLDAAEKSVKSMTERAPIKHQRRAPKYFDFQPIPLRMTQVSEPHRIGAFCTSPAVESVLYDFGAVCVTYQIPLSGPFSGLVTLSEALYDNEGLLADSRRMVEGLLSAIKPAVSRAQISGFYEDYVIFQVRDLDAPQAHLRLLGENSPLVAQVLRADSDLSSEQEVSDALACQISYGADDLSLVDWVSSLIFDKAADDTRAVIEYGQVQLLELRHLDNELDAALDGCYESLSRQTKRRWFPLSSGKELREIGQLQVESALLFEGINNAIKLLGDQYLARVYEQIAKRYHLGSWDESIRRKLRTLESIYTKVEDSQSTARLEFLEWIIIILIALEFMIPFLPGWAR
ncbi:MAG: hypothetical protein A2506_01345 [Elusimicrobia bacterium RIFOXYD12_FULL_66_9]|nr:MAG: hypothetical protein A2506_01345 [Elusimicrobia bacterium RIFOXYD12_FULL_66_9]